MEVRMVFEFLKKYLSSSDAEKDSGDRTQAVEHEGYTIVPMPRKGDGGWSTEGLIERTVDGEVESRHFIRAETHSDRDQAISHSVLKGRRILDEEMRMARNRGS
jgi:hypothetical protein